MKFPAVTSSFPRVQGLLAPRRLLLVISSKVNSRLHIANVIIISSRG